MGAHYVATGHYAQVCKSSLNFELPEGPTPVIRGRAQGRKIERTFANLLCKSIDSLKDQSYFLWTLRQEQLSKFLFPLGHLKKTEVRKLAKKFKLPVAEKKDSQGICFLGVVDLKEFLKHYIKEKKGKVVNEKGEEIGYHDGVVFHTLGERHGFTIIKKSSSDGAYYVVGKNIKKNILIVSQDKNFKRWDLKSSKKSDLKELENFYLILNNTNWISRIPEPNKVYTAQIRYHSEFLNCKIKITGKNSAKIIFENHILVASGQSCVLYDKDICLGGGIVE